MLILKTAISFLLAFLLPVSALPADGSDELPTHHAMSAAVMAESGELLYAYDAERLLPIASTTKLMTALVAAECCDLEKEIEILPAYCGVEGSSMYLRAGERYTVRELLTGLLLVSGNDAAVALACAAAGDTFSFAEQMNRRASELGMVNSHFMNPHGLSEPGHYSTASDLALLMREVMRNDTLAAILATPSTEIGGQLLLNHNKLLRLCPGCLGGKTGYTQLAGRCLVSCAERGGLRLFCVTLNDPDDWTDHAALYDWAYAHFRLFICSEENTRFAVPLLGGCGRCAIAVPDGECKLLLPRGDEPELQVELPFYAFAPVTDGAPAGKLTVRTRDQLICEIPLRFAGDYPIRQVEP